MPARHIQRATVVREGIQHSNRVSQGVIVLVVVALVCLGTGFAAGYLLFEGKAGTGTGAKEVKSGDGKERDVVAAEKEDYQEGYEKGYAKGREKGRREGKKQASVDYKKEIRRVKKTSREEGEKEGFKNGVRKGKEQGLKRGREEGWREGWEEAYSDELEFAVKNITEPILLEKGDYLTVVNMSNVRWERFSIYVTTRGGKSYHFHHHKPLEPNNTYACRYQKFKDNVRNLMPLKAKVGAKFALHFSYKGAAEKEVSKTCTGLRPISLDE